METHDKLRYCVGCVNDFYNRGGNSNTGRCWCLAQAEIVTRFQIGWWTQPTSPTAYRKVLTLACHRAPGQYALHEAMPECFPDYLRVAKEEPFDPAKKG